MEGEFTLGETEEVEDIVALFSHRTRFHGYSIVCKQLVLRIAKG